MTVLSSTNKSEQYIIGGLTVQVNSEGDGLHRQGSGAFENYFYARDLSLSVGTPDITIFFRPYSDRLRNLPDSPETVYSSSVMEILRRGSQVFVLIDNGMFMLDLDACVGSAFVSPDFWKEQGKAIQEFLVLSMLWLFHRLCRYSLHANSVVRDGICIVIVGKSGSGKSTTGLNLISCGWDYLSDDVNLIRQVSDGVEIMPLQRGFSVNPDIVNYHAQLTEYMHSASRNGDKRMIDISQVYPGRLVENAIPQIILFPEITPGADSSVAAIDRTSAFINLMENSGGIMADREMAAGQMKLLKSMVDQTRWFRLLAGRDVYELPEKISDLLDPVL